MEEMELLEEKLKDYHTNIFDNRFLIIYEKDIQAIENLIKAYKELEENSIPKSVIREKIEELKEKVEELSDEEGYWGSSDLLIKIDILEEILEGIEC